MLTFVPSQAVLGKHTHSFSPTHINKLTQAVPQGRGYAQQSEAGREESWLKEVRKVKMIVKETEKWKVGDKTQGGK